MSEELIQYVLTPEGDEEEYRLACKEESYFNDGARYDDDDSEWEPDPDSPPLTKWEEQAFTVLQILQNRRVASTEGIKDSMGLYDTLAEQDLGYTAGRVEKYAPLSQESYKPNLDKVLRRLVRKKFIEPVKVEYLIEETADYPVLKPKKGPKKVSYYVHWLAKGTGKTAEDVIEKKARGEGTIVPPDPQPFQVNVDILHGGLTRN